MLFLLGFPAGGLVWFWADAHGRIERNALPAAEGVAKEFLAAWDGEVLEEAGTNEFRLGLPPTQVADWEGRFGPFRSLGPMRAEKSWAGARNDMVWQFVQATGEAQFEKGAATLRVTVARRTMSPEWRVESLTLEPR